MTKDSTTASNQSSSALNPSNVSRSMDFKCADGVGNTLQIFQSADTSNNAPVVVFVPAMGIPARKYDAFCNAMADYGVNVACFDVRGLGNSSVRVSRSVDFSYATVVEQEYCAALRLVAQEFPKSRLLLVGHSLGGQLGALYTAHAKHHASKGWVIPDGLGLIASCSIYHKGWPFPMSFGLLGFTQFSLMLSKILGYFPGKYVGFGGSEARSLISDWAYGARSGRYDLISDLSSKSRIAYDPMLAKVTEPVISINFAEDTLAPLKPTRFLVDKLNTSDWQRHLIDKDSLGTKQADHYQWMRSPNLPAKRIAEWALRN